MIVLAAAVALAAACWVVLLLTAPLLPGQAGAVIYSIGSLVCHQIPERSFHLAGAQLPVCARCLGIYAGASFGAVARVWLLPGTGRIARAMGTPGVARQLAVASAMPMVLTWSLEAARVWAPSNVTRAAAAVPFGGVVALVVIGALATLHYGECAPSRPIEPTPRPPHS